MPMPTVLTVSGLRFRIYTQDHQPPHVHVIGREGAAKLTIGEHPELMENRGLRSGEVRLALATISVEAERLLGVWRQYHG